jgi:hypothetical protein
MRDRSSGARPPRPRRRTSIAALLVAAGSLAGASLGTAGCGGGSSAQSPSANRDPVCVLVDGDLASWRGLPPHTVDDLPECLGARKDRTSMTYHSLVTDIDYYQPALGVEVWVYGAVADGKVALIEIRRERPQVVDAVQRVLGVPAAVYRWSAEDRVQAGPAASAVTRDPELTVDELVYGDRGLAVAVARRGAQPPVVFRARGFAPTAPDAYLDAVVRLAPQ